MKALLCTVAISVVSVLMSAPSYSGENEWSQIRPTGGLARAFIEVGDELWMDTHGAVLKSDNAGESWIEQPQVPDAFNLVVSPHDPDLFYRGGWSEIHRSIDGGVTWTTTELPTTAVFGDWVVGIAFDQADPMSAYAAVQNVGIYATDNGGATWALLPAQPASLRFQSLFADPHNPGVFYLGVQEDGVYKTTDWGASWNAMNTGLPLRYIDIITFDPTTPNTVFVGSDGDYEIYRSLDGGASWAELTGGLPSNGLTPSAIEPGNAPDEFYATFDSTTALGSGARAFKSVDGGDNWTGLTPPVAARGPQTTAIYVDPATAGRLIIGTRIGNFVSLDDGATWTWSNDGFNRTDITDFAFGADAGELYVSSSLGGVLQTLDTGASWTHLNSGIEEPHFQAIAVNPHNAEHIIATNFDGPFVSNDGGTTWDSFDYSNMVVHALTFDSFDASTAYAVADGGSTLLRTMDGGVSWADFPTGASFVGSAIPTKIVASELTPGLLYKNHHDGVFKSVDGGETWNLANGNLPAETAFTVALHPDDTVFASFGMDSYRSDDGGETWEQVWTTTEAGNGQLLSLAFDSRDPLRMLAATRTSVLGSIDGGTNWHDLDAGVVGDLIFVNSIAFDPVVERRYFMNSNTSSDDGVLMVYSGGIAVDLEASMTRTPSSVEVGETVSVEFSVSNLAGDPAEAAAFTMTIPSAFELTSWTFANATCDANGLTLECTLPTLAVDAVTSGTATLTSTSAGNGSVVIAVESTVEPDNDTTNDSKSESLSATNPATNPPPTTSPPESGGGGGRTGLGFALLCLLAAGLGRARMARSTARACQH